MINKYAILRLFENGRFSAREFEEAAYKDSALNVGDFFSDYLSEDLKKWRDACNAGEIFKNLFRQSFVFGVCGTFDTYQRERRFETDMRRKSSKYRARMFAQVITPNKALRKWIDDTDCIDFIYDLYEKSYICGGKFLVDAVKRSQVIFEKE